MTSSRSSSSSASPSVPGSSLDALLGDARRVHLEQRLLDRVGEDHVLLDAVEAGRDHRREREVRVR